MKNSDYFIMEVKASESCLHLTELAFLKHDIKACIIGFNRFNNYNRNRNFIQISVKRNCPKVECIKLIESFLIKYSEMEVIGLKGNFWAPTAS